MVLVFAFYPISYGCWEKNLQGKDRHILNNHPIAHPFLYHSILIQVSTSFLQLVKMATGKKRKNISKDCCIWEIIACMFLNIKPFNLVKCLLPKNLSMTTKVYISRTAVWHTESCWSLMEGTWHPNPFITIMSGLVLTTCTE